MNQGVFGMEALAIVVRLTSPSLRTARQAFRKRGFRLWVSPAACRAPDEPPSPAADRDRHSARAELSARKARHRRRHSAGALGGGDLAWRGIGNGGGPCAAPFERPVGSPTPSW